MTRPKRPLLHAGEDRLQEQQRRFDEELELVQVELPGLVFNGVLRLGAGGVGDEDVDVAEMAGDRGDERGNLLLVANVGGKVVGVAARVADLLADLLGFGRRGEVVHGDVDAIAAKRASHGSA